jgi:hypothetical protein
LTDRPFVERREQLLSYYLLDAKDLDVAIAIAPRIPGGPTAGVEIRPLVEHPSQATA